MKTTKNLPLNPPNKSEVQADEIAKAITRLEPMWVCDITVDGTGWQVHCWLDKNYTGRWFNCGTTNGTWGGDYWKGDDFMDKSFDTGLGEFADVETIAYAIRNNILETIKD